MKAICRFLQMESLCSLLEFLLCVFFNNRVSVYQVVSIEESNLISSFPLNDILTMTCELPFWHITYRIKENYFHGKEYFDILFSNTYNVCSEKLEFPRYSWADYIILFTWHPSAVLLLRLIFLDDFNHKIPMSTLNELLVIIIIRIIMVIPM